MFWGEWILNRNLGISEHGNQCFYFVDSVLRAYATAEHSQSTAEKRLKAPSAHETHKKVSTAMSGEGDRFLDDVRFGEDGLPVEVKVNGVWYPSDGRTYRDVDGSIVKLCL